MVTRNSTFQCSNGSQGVCEVWVLQEALEVYDQQKVAFILRIKTRFLGKALPDVGCAAPDVQIRWKSAHGLKEMS